MSKYVIDEKTLTDIADAIRAKKGTGEPIFTENFALEIYEIENKEIKGMIDGSITEIDIPKTVTEIGVSAFQNRKALIRVGLHEGIKKINNYGFSYCNQLSGVSIPSAVESIGAHAFYYCEKITDFTFGDNALLEDIGENAFYTCRGLKNIQMPKKLKKLGNQAFYNCTNCLEYDFSECESIPYVGTNAFYGINSNAKIIVPEDLFLSWRAATNWVAYEDYITTPLGGFVFTQNYMANEGMTFRDWVNSKYNTEGFYIDGGVWEPNTGCQITEYSDGIYTGVTPDELIVKGTRYIVS